MDKQEIEEIIERYKDPEGRVLSILEDIQDADRYLSQETLKVVSEELGIPLSQLFSIATFYSFFNLKPVGEHIITVCMGTACHVRGSAILLNNLKSLLHVEENEATEDGKFFLTTEDKHFSLNTARCFGCCSMAPVLKVDDKIYGYVTANWLPKILKEYGWNENENQ